MSSTEMPTLSPAIRHSPGPIVERGGVIFRVGETIHLASEHYLYRDSLLDPQPITLQVLWIGALRILNGIVMVPLEGIEIEPVANRKRCILANFNALCVAAPMNPKEAGRNPPPGSAVRPNDTAPNERASGWSSGE